MRNRITILQPSYLPWIGYFDQINRSDTFIFFDDVLYTKNDWRNRNKIKTPNGSLWLTLSVKLKGRISNQLKVKDAVIANSDILRSHLKTIGMNYKNAQHFESFYNLLKEILNRDYQLLTNLNIDIIKMITKYLDLSAVSFLHSSELNILYDNPTDHLLKICKKLKATHYLTGDSARGYLSEEEFKKNNIVLEYQNYQHPIYRQLWGEFIPYLSIVDLIFNEGKRSKEILSGGKK